MFNLKFKTDNAAFDDQEVEIVNVLENVIASIKDGLTKSNVYDSNGNKIGYYKLT